MFGGPHHKDEVIRVEQCGWSAKNKTAVQVKIPANRVLLRPRTGVGGNGKTRRIPLDTADFIRHVPEFPCLLSCNSAQAYLYFPL